MVAGLGNRKVQVIILCALAGVVLYNVVHFSGGKRRSHNLVYEGGDVESELVTASAPNWATGGYKQPGPWRRNPFTAAAPAHAAAPTPAAKTTSRAPAGKRDARFTVTGVLISGDERCVLAGDILLREGDMLGAGRIKTINRNSVVVEYETGTKTIYIE